MWTFNTSEPNIIEEHYTLKEATLVYSIETYLNTFLAIVKGKSYIEAHTALGRTDLLIKTHLVPYNLEKDF